MPSAETIGWLELLLYGAILAGTVWAFLAVLGFDMFRYAQAHALTELRHKRLGQLQEALERAVAEREEFRRRAQTMSAESASRLLGRMIDRSMPPRPPRP